MIEVNRPKTNAIKAKIAEIVQIGAEFKDRNAVARAIFLRWRNAHISHDDRWFHGGGKKANATPPDPDQANPYSSLMRYITGHAMQNRRGWEMVAEVLVVRVEDLIDFPSRISAEVPTMFAPFGAVMAPGQLPLSKLANIDVARPLPLMGANAVFSDPNRKQAISLSARAIFNTIRSEEICSKDGDLIAVADFELTHAYLVVHVSDPNMTVLGGIGMEGKVECGDIQISYHGTQDDLVLFELAAKAQGGTLAGIVQRLENLVQLEGRFVETDFLGTAVEKNGIRPMNLRFEGQDDELPQGRFIIQAMKRQLLSRGIRLDCAEDAPDEKWLTAKRYFMKPIAHDPES